MPPRATARDGARFGIPAVDLRIAHRDPFYETSLAVHALDAG